MRVIDKEKKKILECRQSTSDEGNIPYEKIQSGDEKKLFSESSYTLRCRQYLGVEEVCEEKLKCGKDALDVVRDDTKVSYLKRLIISIDTQFRALNSKRRRVVVT